MQLKILSFLLVWSLLAGLSYAQQESLVLVTEIWPPYRIGESSSATGLSGIDIDLVRELESRLGLRFEIRLAPWARALDMLRRGQADLMTGVAWTAERATYLSYVPTSYSAVRPMFLAPAGKGNTVRSYADLRGKSIGISTQSAYFEPFNSDTSLQKVTLATEEQILHMLALGRLDLAVGTDPNLSWDVARLGYRQRLEATAWQPPDSTPLYLAVSPNSHSANLVERLDAAIRDLISDGTIRSILERYK